MPKDVNAHARWKRFCRDHDYIRRREEREKAAPHAERTFTGLRLSKYEHDLAVECGGGNATRGIRRLLHYFDRQRSGMEGVLDEIALESLKKRR